MDFSGCKVTVSECVQVHSRSDWSCSVNVSRCFIRRQTQTTIIFCTCKKSEITVFLFLSVLQSTGLGGKHCLCEIAAIKYNSCGTQQAQSQPNC